MPQGVRQLVQQSGPFGMIDGHESNFPVRVEKFDGVSESGAQATVSVVKKNIVRHRGHR
jgi:hypothetical protein